MKYKHVVRSRSSELKSHEFITAFLLKELKNEVNTRTGQLSLASAAEQALREELSAKKAQEEVLIAQIAELQKDAVSLKLKHAAERDSLLRHFEQNANANMNWARSVQG